MTRLLFAVLAFVLTAGAQTKTILVLNRPAEDVAAWQAASSKVKLVRVTRDTVMDHIADADAFIGSIRPAEVRAGKKLKWVQSMSAGVERVLHLSGGDDLRNSDIVLTNNQIVQGPEIADHAMAMLLTLTRRIPKFIANRQSETWQGRPYDGIELNGKTALVIGVGGIGSQIALRAWAHGMTVMSALIPKICRIRLSSRRSSSLTGSTRSYRRRTSSSWPRLGPARAPR